MATNNTQSNQHTTYTLRAKFISPTSGRSQGTKVVASNLSLYDALEKKTQLLERVPHCVSASVTPDK